MGAKPAALVQGLWRRVLGPPLGSITACQHPQATSPQHAGQAWGGARGEDRDPWGSRLPPSSRPGFSQGSCSGSLCPLAPQGAPGTPGLITADAPQLGCC